MVPLYKIRKFRRAALELHVHNVRSLREIPAVASSEHAAACPQPVIHTLQIPPEAIEQALRATALEASITTNYLAVHLLSTVRLVRVGPYRVGLARSPYVHNTSMIG